MHFLHRLKSVSTLDLKEAPWTPLMIGWSWKPRSFGQISPSWERHLQMDHLETTSERDLPIGDGWGWMQRGCVCMCKYACTLPPGLPLETGPLLGPPCGWLSTSALPTLSPSRSCGRPWNTSNPSRLFGDKDSVTRALRETLGIPFAAVLFQESVASAWLFQRCVSCALLPTGTNRWTDFRLINKVLVPLCDCVWIALNQLLCSNIGSGCQALSLLKHSLGKWEQ